MLANELRALAEAVFGADAEERVAVELVEQVAFVAAEVRAGVTRRRPRRA